MRTQLKELIKLFVPPILLKCWHSFRDGSRANSYGYLGNCRTWDEAVRNSLGYDNEIILQKTKQALLKVKNGVVAYERDSVLFDKIEYSWPVLAGLLRCAVENDGKLHVLDFGGSLGSSYYQNRAFLSGLKEFSWSIVEQPHFVACGKKDFVDGILQFYDTIEACLVERKPQVVLLSSVLPYLERPYEQLQKIIHLDAEYLMIDRTAFIKGVKDVITVQRVSPEIYEASYPAWAFNEDSLKAFISPKYDLLVDCPTSDGSNYPGMYFKALIFRRKR